MGSSFLWAFTSSIRCVMLKKMEIQKILLLRLEFTAFWQFLALVKNFTKQKKFVLKTKVVVLTWVNNFVKRQKISTCLLSEITGGLDFTQKYTIFALFLRGKIQTKSLSILQQLKTCFHILQPNYGNKILKVDITFVQMSGTPLKVGPKLAGTLGPLLPTGRHQKWV